MRYGRIELEALSGLRFWATLGIIAGHAIETLWIDNGHGCEWLSKYTCSAIRRSADDLVSFYFVLSGFSIHWGYASRDLDSYSTRTRYWVGRVQRFYPDFAISSVLTFIVEAIPLFGCHAISLLKWGFNFASFFLLGAWLIFIPGTGYLNGPAWFMVSLVWLWIFYPLISGHVKTFFQSETIFIFLAKIVGVWVISLIPWLVLVTFSSLRIGFGFATFGDIAWGVKGCPIFRLAEFVIGIAIAIRVKEDMEYVPCESNEENSAATDSSKPLVLLIVGCVVGLLAILGFYAVSTAYLSPQCNCLDVNIACYGWLQFVDTRFALYSALIIYTVASLDAAAASQAESAQEGVKARAGLVGLGVCTFLRWAPFQEVNKWGLQAFLYQTFAQTILQCLLVDIHWGLENRCSEQPLSPIFSIWYVLIQMAFTYFVAWLMHEQGPLGKQVHALAKKLASSVIAMLTGEDDEEKNKKKSTIQYA